MTAHLTLKDEYSLGTYVVCLLDFLGQKEKLAQWGDPATFAVESALPAIRKSVGTVLAFREVLNRVFSALAESSSGDLDLNSLSPTQKEAYEKFKDTRLGIQQFADTFIFYAPTNNAYGEVSSLALHQVMGACCATVLTALAARIPVRGSICVHLGIELDDNNFYGPALAEAHFIEREVAQYPRVIVSESALRFLHSFRGAGARGILGRMMETLAVRCAAMICTDCDGQHVLDYLGPAFRRGPGADQSPEYSLGVKTGYDFVVSEAIRFRAAGNAKLGLRYHLWQQYIESRLALWK